MYAVPDLPGDGIHRCEETIRRSRFIVTLAHTSSIDAARSFVESIRQEFPDATHNCWAFAAGPPGDTNRIGYSDDGEPHGTAGRPMLAVLLHGSVGELAAVVTRYFGGIKLGTGGLVRAYQEMVQKGLATLPLRQHMTLARLEVIFDYCHLSRFRRLAADHHAVVEDETFGMDVTCQILLPDMEIPAFSAALRDATGGAVLISTVADAMPPFA